MRNEIHQLVPKPSILCGFACSPSLQARKCPLNRFRGGPKLGLFALTLQEFGARCLDMLEFWPRHTVELFFFPSILRPFRRGKFCFADELSVCIFTSICQSGFICLESRVKIRKPLDSSMPWLNFGTVNTNDFVLRCFDKP